MAIKKKTSNKEHGNKEEECQMTVTKTSNKKLKKYTQWLDTIAYIQEPQLQLLSSGCMELPSQRFT